MPVKSAAERWSVTLRLTDCVVEVYDATVLGKPPKLRVDGIKGTVEDIRLPELTNRTRVDLSRHQ